MAETKLQFLDLAGLSKYDSHNKTYIDQRIAEKTTTSLKGVAISEDGNSLLFYTDYPIEGASPAYELEVPKTDLSGVIEKFKSATAGNVITVAEDGMTIVDSGMALTNVAKKSDVEAMQTSIDQTSAAVDALKALVSTIPEGYEAKTIVEYIKEVTDAIAANGYDDTALQKKVTDLQNEINTLKGEATVEGSVKKTVVDEIAKIIADAPESFDTLKEISDWISNHETDAAGMNSKIQANTTAIDVLEAFVGTLPEGAASTTVVDYIAEALGKADFSKYALASDLKTAVDRIVANENAIKIIDASLKEGGTTYNAIKKAQETGDSAKEAVDTLSTYVGHFTVGDEESVETVVAYIDYKVSKLTTQYDEKIANVETKITNLTGRVDTLETKVGNNTTNIESIQDKVNSIESISESDIEALFDEKE